LLYAARLRVDCLKVMSGLGPGVDIAAIADIAYGLEEGHHGARDPIDTLGPGARASLPYPAAAIIIKILNARSLHRHWNALMMSVQE
jgi:hypothetical protein